MKRKKIFICLSALLSMGVLVSCTLSPERAGFAPSGAGGSSATVKKVAGPVDSQSRSHVGFARRRMDETAARAD